MGQRRNGVFDADLSRAVLIKTDPHRLMPLGDPLNGSSQSILVDDALDTADVGHLVGSATFTAQLAAHPQQLLAVGERSLPSGGSVNGGNRRTFGRDRGGDTGRWSGPARPEAACRHL